jgi:hypothetical protein
MASWSVSRLLGKISMQDFNQAVTGLRDSLQNHGSGSLFVEIGLYRRKKPELESTGVDFDSGSMVRRLGPVEEFRFVSDPREITPALWREADYVQAVIHPVGKSDVSARVEAKGLQPRQMTFAVGPDEPGEIVKKESTDAFRHWLRDDGVNSNRIVYGI